MITEDLPSPETGAWAVCTMQARKKWIDTPNKTIPKSVSPGAARTGVVRKNCRFGWAWTYYGLRLLPTGGKYARGCARESNNFEEAGVKTDDLKQKMISSSFWSSLESTAVQVLSFLVFMVLARLLQPDDYGILAVAMVFVTLVGAITGFGIQGAIVQIRELHADHLNGGFWFSLATGALLYGLICAVAPWLASLYGEPELEPVLFCLGLIGLFQSMGVVPSAILSRNFRYRYLAFRAVISNLVGGVLGITMAVYGYGVWALVAQQMSQVILRTLLTWFGAAWTPGLIISWAPLKRLLSVGLYLMGSGFANTLSRQTDNLLIGIFIGTRELGIYSIGYKVFETVNGVMLGSVSRLGLPTFSRLQSNPQRLANAYHRAWTVGAALTLPVFMLILLTAPELVPFLFGEQWRDSAVVLQLLMVASCCRSLTNFDSTLLVACGRPRLAFRLTLARTLLSIAGFAIAVQWGINAIAAVVAIVAVTMLPLWKFAVARCTSATLSQAKTQLVSLGIGLLLLGGSVVLVAGLLPAVQVPYKIAAQWACGLFVYWASVCGLDTFLRAGLQELLHLGVGRP